MASNTGIHTELGTTAKAALVHFGSQIEAKDLLIELS